MREIGKYTPGEIESKWYSHWLDNNYFHAEVSDEDPYTIVIPPPNVLNRIVQHVSHVEHTCDVWWRNDYGIGLFITDFRVEVVIVQPVAVPL